jgi:hypothetical protein
MRQWIEEERQNGRREYELQRLTVRDFFAHLRSRRAASRRPKQPDGERPALIGRSIAAAIDATMESGLGGQLIGIPYDIVKPAMTGRNRLARGG